MSYFFLVRSISFDAALLYPSNMALYKHLCDQPHKFIFQRTSQVASTGILSYYSWRLVFLVSVPVGVVGTIWAYLMLRETATIRQHQHVDWAGNLTFAIGLTVFLLGITYGIEPYGNSPMGWGNPLVIGMLVGGALMLAIFIWVELRVPDPMFRLSLFQTRAFAAGNISSFLASIARGGLQFMLIIWRRRCRVRSPSG